MPSALESVASGGRVPAAREVVPQPTWHVAVHASTLAQGLADWVAQRLRTAIAERGQALLVVSGGSTPRPFLEALSQAELDWRRLHVTLADERLLPSDHPDHNGRMVRQHLLQAEAGAAHWCPLLRPGLAVPEGAQALAEACADLERRLARLPWPADVVVLGMGGDGHTASWFPHAPELAQALRAEAGPRCLAVAAPPEPNLPVARITLTARALLDARELVLHTTGAAKHAVLQRACGQPDALALPVRRVLWQEQVPCHIFHAD